MARHYGLKKLAVPSAGNAAGALAAYAAAAGIEAHIFMPKDVPFANYVEAVVYGAKVNLIDGLISDCGRIVAERKEKEGWFDISTLKEPFRVEGKKTMVMNWSSNSVGNIPTRCLSHGRRRGPDWNVEIVLGIRRTWLVRPGKTAPYDRSAVLGCAPVAALSSKGLT